MKTTYEMTPADIRADPARGGSIQINAAQGPVTIRLLLTLDAAVAFKRNLARIIDPEGGVDPSGHTTIHELWALLRLVDNPTVQTDVLRPRVAEALRGYIGLIEWINRED